MRPLTAIALLLVTACGYIWAGDSGWDYLYGEWREKHVQKEGGVRTVVVFEKTRIIVTGPNGKEVWRVVEGDNLLRGLVVERKGRRERTSCIVKFNEMGFRLGERYWLLRQAGTEDIRMPAGVTINEPAVNSGGPQIDVPEAERDSITIGAGKRPKAEREPAAPADH